MSQITTHVLDTTRGKPAANLAITLSQKTDSGWQVLSSGMTNQDGRIAGLLNDDIKLAAGIYQMHFDTKSYFDANNETGFYPYVDIVFELDDKGEHYHIPLLLTAYGYSTYRGS